MKNILSVAVVALALGAIPQKAMASLYAENHPASACQLELPALLDRSVRPHNHYDGILTNEDASTFYVVCPVVNDPTKNIINIQVSFAHTTGSRTCWFNAVDFNGNSHYTSATGTSLVVLSEASGGVFENVICPLRPGEKLLGYTKAYSN